VDELKQGYKKLMGKNYATKKVMKIFKQIDFEGKGTIDYSEFVVAGISKE